MAVIETSKEESSVEKRLSTAISVFNSNLTKVKGVDEDTRKYSQNLIKDPALAEKYLTTEGRAFYIPATADSKKFADEFVKKLQLLGYAAFAMMGTGSDSNNYIIYTGKLAIDQAYDLCTVGKPAKEQKAALKAFVDSVPAVLEYWQAKGYDTGLIVERLAAVEQMVGGATPAGEATVASKVPAPVSKPKEEGKMALTWENLGLVPPKAKQPVEHPSDTLILPVPSKQPGKAEQAKITRLEKQLEEQLAILRENSEAWKATGRSKIAQAYHFLREVKDSLEKEGYYTNPGGAVADNEQLFVKEGKKEGNIVRWEKAIAEVQEAYAKALGMIESLYRLGADTERARKELEGLQPKLTEEVLSYQRTPIKVKALDGGYNLYAAKTEKGKTTYAFYDVEEPAEQAGGVASIDRDRYISMLWTQGLNDSVAVYKQARETLVNNLTSEQLKMVMDYAQGKTGSLLLKVDPNKQGAIQNAISYLCNVNGFSSPSFELAKGKPGEIVAEGRVSAIPIPKESMDLLQSWGGTYLTDAERRMLAGKFGFEDISKMIDFIDRARLAFSQGREPMEYLSADQGVFVPKGGLDLQTARALNALFLYAGGISITFYENAGYLYSTGATMYAEPEVIKFEFPVKISHKEGKRERWLRMERVPEKAKKIEDAVNGGKGGEIQFGKLFKENPEDARLYAIHKRQAEIVVGYLNAQGIRATMEEFQQNGKYFGIKVIIPENAMGVGEVQRKPRKIQATEASLLEAGPAKVDPLRAINNLPEDIANSKMKSSLLAGVKKEEETVIRCASQDQATRMRNWLIMNGGIPAEKLELQSAQVTRTVDSDVPGQTTKATRTEWALAYYPEAVTKYALRELEPRGKKEPIHQTLYQKDIISRKRGEALKGELEDQAEAYETANPGKEVTVEFSAVSGSRKKDPAPRAAETFHNESAFGDAFLAMAFEFAWRTEADLPKAPAVGGYRRLRDAMESYLNVATEDGKFRHGDRFAMMMLREWRHPGEALSFHEERGVANAYAALDGKYANMEEFAKELSPENAMKLRAAAEWMAERWLAQYDTKGMKPGEVEALRNSLTEVAWKTMMVVIQLEAGPAHYGVGPGKERPQTPEEHLAGALLYMGNNEFTTRDGKKYQTYFEHEGVRYNILSRRVLAAGPNPDHYVTIPSGEPGKVLLYGRLRQKNVQLQDGRWVPAYEVVPLPKPERKLMGRDSLGETSFTPEFSGPLPYAKIRIGDKPKEKEGPPIEVETRVPIGARVEGEAVMFSAGMEIQWDKIYLRFLSPKDKVFAAMKGKPVMLEEIVVTSETPKKEMFILPPRHRQNSKGEEIDKNRKYSAIPGGTVYASAYVEENGNIVVFQKKGEAAPENARKHYKDTPDELAKKGIEKIVIGERNAESGRVVLADRFKAEYDKHVFGSRVVRQNELKEEGSIKNDRGETVDYRYRLEDADIGAHRKVVASGVDGDKANVRTNLPYEATETTKVTFKVKGE